MNNRSRFSNTFQRRNSQIDSRSLNPYQRNKTIYRVPQMSTLMLQQDSSQHQIHQ